MFCNGRSFGCDGLESLSGLGFRIGLVLSGAASILSLFSCRFDFSVHLERIVGLEPDEPQALEVGGLLKAGRAQCP